jgi:hypothetical protein
MIVKGRDVRFYKIAEVRAPSGRAVRVSGLVFHSSLAVERIVQKRAGDAVILKVFLTPARGALSGSFDVDVPISEEVKRVLFGEPPVEIWPVLDKQVQPPAIPRAR